MRKIRIGTRGSKLALWQAEWVKERIEKQTPQVKVELVIIKTLGDKILDVALAKVGGKGLFVKEIEEALLDQRIDIAVHSMKDVPTKLADTLHIAAITEREDPRDVMISNRWKRLDELPFEAKVGTSSLRRQAQLLHVRPDLKMTVLRGNLDTRLRKLSEEGLDAIIVAAAGVIRLGLQQKITQYLDFDLCLPAMGQGTLALECRQEDNDINEILKPLNAPYVSMTVRAERAFLEKLEGGCQVPIGIYGEIRNGALLLKGLIASIDGKKLVSDEISGDPKDPESVGKKLAERLLNSGGKAILKEIYGSLSKD
ncbi:MAG: hydroxymethylbilane synthase [Deltaproteobacteria bacterium]|nr:hydroxymethylbilane synthase [Deltaproteobacteria bacterium]